MLTAKFAKNAKVGGKCEIQTVMDEGWGRATIVCVMKNTVSLASFAFFAFLAV